MQCAETLDDSWNPATWDEAAKSKDPAFVYSASKALAERTAWDAVKSKKLHCPFTAICPPCVRRLFLHLWLLISLDLDPG